MLRQPRHHRDVDGCCVDTEDTLHFVPARDSGHGCVAPSSNGSMHTADVLMISLAYGMVILWSAQCKHAVATPAGWTQLCIAGHACLQSSRPNVSIISPCMHC